MITLRTVARIAILAALLGSVAACSHSSGSTGASPAPATEPPLDADLAGRPDSATEAFAAALQLGLSADEVAHLLGIDWAKMTAPAFVEDATVRKAFAVGAANVPSNVRIQALPRAAGIPSPGVRLAGDGDPTCIDLRATITADLAKVGAKLAAGAALGAATCPATLGLGCIAAILLTASGVADLVGGTGVAAALGAFSNALNGCNDSTTNQGGAGGSGGDNPTGQGGGGETAGGSQDSGGNGDGGGIAEGGAGGSSQSAGAAGESSAGASAGGGGATCPAGMALLICGNTSKCALPGSTCCNGAKTDLVGAGTSAVLPAGVACYGYANSYDGFSCPAGTTCSPIEPVVGSGSFCLVDGASNCGAAYYAYGVCPVGTTCTPIKGGNLCVPPGFAVCEGANFNPQNYPNLPQTPCGGGDPADAYSSLCPPGTQCSGSACKLAMKGVPTLDPAGSPSASNARRPLPSHPCSAGTAVHPRPRFLHSGSDRFVTLSLP